MSFQLPNATFIATGDINPARFVKQSGGFGIAQAGAGENTIGISQDTTKLFNSSLAGASGDPVAVSGESEETWLEYGGSVTAGDRLKSDANGKGVTAGATEASGAVAMQSGATGPGSRYRVRVETFIAAVAGATGATGATGPGA